MEDVHMNQNSSVSRKNTLMGPFTAQKLCVIAIAIVLNVIGGNIALALHLPIFLDSMGTILIALIYGPVYGILPPLLYGLVMGFTVDIFSLYYMPVGMLLGLVTGLVAMRFSLKGWRIFPGAFLITVPGTIISSIITAVLFGGITSSGGTVIVQVLHKAGLSLTASVFIVQILTDYLDRVISLFLVMSLLLVIPKRLYQDQH